MMKIYITSDFCNGCKHLIASNQNEAVHNLRTVLILLANEKDIPKKYKDYKLTDSPYRELHITGDILLLYRRETNPDTLVISLKLSDITNHKGLRQKARKDDHDYFEVSTTELNEITSSTNCYNLSSLDYEFLNDFAESLSDYASMDMEYGYVLLSDFYIDNDILHCLYDYYCYDDNTSYGSIDFVIELSQYASDGLYMLNSYIEEFAAKIRNAFEKFL